FFFSSRRRHTRFSRDWSSDVCSSDLICDASSKITSSNSAWSADRYWAIESGDIIRQGARVVTTSGISCISSRTDLCRAFFCSSWRRMPQCELRVTSPRSEEHTSELQSRENLVCRLLLE